MSKTETAAELKEAEKAEKVETGEEKAEDGKAESAKPDEEKDCEDEAAKKKKSKMKKIILLAATAALVIGASLGTFFVWRSAGYLTTDNARVTTNQFHIASDTPGRLERYMIYEGRYVEENELIGWVEHGSAMRSPVAGLVVYSSAVQGQIVPPMTPIAIIAETGRIHIRANIRETDIVRLSEGGPAYITIDGLGNRRFSGYISNIGSITDAELSGQAMFFNTGGTFTRVVHLIPVEINITDDVNLDHLIGLNARVRFPLR